MSRRAAPADAEEEEEKVVPAKVSHVDMPEEMLAKCVQAARAALKVCSGAGCTCVCVHGA